MRPGQYLTRSLVYVDNRGVDGAVNGLAALVGGTSGRIRRWQTGFVRSYALVDARWFGAHRAGAAGGEAGMTGSEMTVPWLTILIALPLVGAVAVMLLPRGTGDLPKQVALRLLPRRPGDLGRSWRSQFDADGGFQFVEMHDWIASFGAWYAVGLDGLGLVLVLLTTILTPVVILASWNDADDGRWSVNSFFAWMLALEGLAVGVFAATDVFLFYVLFEATLIPIYFLIGGFGGARRSYAAVKFLLFSLFGGLLMLASVVGLYVVSSDTERRAVVPARGPDEPEPRRDEHRRPGAGCSSASSSRSRSRRRCGRCTRGCPRPPARRTPGTSVLLVSVLDKIGTFGMMRFCLGHLPRGVAVGDAGRDRAGGDLGAVRRAAGHRAERHPPADRVHVGVALRLHRAGHLRVHQPGPGRLDRSTCSTTGSRRRRCSSSPAS